MSDSQPTHGTHAGKPAAPEHPEPTHAEKAKTLVFAGGISSLSTHSKKHTGYPFGSVMPYGLTESGKPLFLISSMAMHTRNLLDNPKATLLIIQDSEDGDSLGAGRVSVMGTVSQVEESEVEKLSANYLHRNPNAQSWIHFGDFGLFKMEILDVYFVGGFGVMGWVSAEEYFNANPDPLTESAAGIIQHMNDDHADALGDIVRHFAGLECTDAKMTAIDRLGFHVRVKTDQGYKGFRIPFPTSVKSSNEVRESFMSMMNQIPADSR